MFGWFWVLRFGVRIYGGCVLDFAVFGVHLLDFGFGLYSGGDLGLVSLYWLIVGLSVGGFDLRCFGFAGC